MRRGTRRPTTACRRSSEGERPATMSATLPPAATVASDAAAAPKVMGDDEQFHATDEAVQLSGTPLEGWVALGIFWVLGATVFYQFFTRYVLNNSASWTEEIARY